MVREPIDITWYWLESVLEEDDGMLAPLTGVPAVKQDIDMVASNWQRFTTFNSEKMKFHRMNASSSNSLDTLEDPQIPPS